MPSRTLSLRRADHCARCGTALVKGTRASWDADVRAVTCLSCLATPCHQAPTAVPSAQQPIDRGVPGASARREYVRRGHNREQRTRQAHPHIGGLLLVLRNQPQHEQAFLRGARGEEAVAGSLEARTADSPTMLLHDRRMPRGHGNIDHIAIAPNGIFVVDTKDWKGKVRVSTPLFGKSRLMIEGRDRTTLVDGLDRQVAAVARALSEAAQAWPIQGVFCFTQADLPLMGLLDTPRIRSHLLLHRKTLARRLNASGPFTAAQIDAVARVLAEALPTA